MPNFSILSTRPRLLIVDDQPINIQILFQIFQPDCEVFMATSGQQAIDFCLHNQPDLILLDVMMPGMDGLTTCKLLKELPATADIPIIFVTAQNDPMDETHALEVGGVDFISKPVNTAVVRARVKTHLTLKAQSDMLRKLALIDGLTGVANRRCFDQTLEAEWRRCQRSDASLALLMVDVDHFKLYNDHYGHQAGDVCLQTIASTLQQSFHRSHDLTARYGGEEFACLLPETDLHGAKAKAENIRNAVEKLQLPHATSLVSKFVTLSIGVAAFIPHDAITAQDLIVDADRSLYMAKDAGRNRVGY